MLGAQYGDAPPDVPALIGTLEAHGVRYVFIGSVAALTVPRRKKDIPRVRKLREIQRLLDK